MKIAALQTLASPDLPTNLDRAEGALASAKKKGAALAVLPEYFACYGSDETLAASADRADEVIERIGATAGRLGMGVMGGGVVRRPKGADRPVNETIFFDEKGRLLATYRKINLFAATVNGKQYGEGLWLKPGRHVTVADYNGWRIGLATCFDLRFPDHFARLCKKGADLIVVPSAFTATTGRSHWAPLVTGRAIENQCYVVAPGLAGSSQERKVYGHTMGVDPWGKSGGMAEGEGIVMTTLSKTVVERTRKTIPMGIG